MIKNIRQIKADVILKDKECRTWKVNGRSYDVILLQHYPCHQDKPQKKVISSLEAQCNYEIVKLDRAD